MRCAHVPLMALAIASLLSGNMVNAGLKVQLVGEPPGDSDSPRTLPQWLLSPERSFRDKRGSPPGFLGGSFAAPSQVAAATSAAGAFDWSFKPVQVKVETGSGDARSVPIVVVPIPVPVPTPNAACPAPTTFVGAAPGHIPSSGPVKQLEFKDEPTQPIRPSQSTHQTQERFPPPLPDVPLQPQSLAIDDDNAALPPRIEPIFSSQELVEEFRAQIPSAPELPPMLLSGGDASERAPVPYGTNAVVLETGTEDSPPSPPLELPQSRTSAGFRSRSSRVQDSEPNSRSSPPSYNSASLRLIKGQVTVRRADYTEPYSIWFDEQSGNARTDFHGGSASTFRTVMSDGRVRRAVVWVQRSGASTVRRCAMATVPQSEATSSHPALPDLSQFTFAGKEETQFGNAEVWKRTVEGGVGEQAAARGEALTTRHEMRLLRVDGTGVPLRYTVAVDSSTLGPDCDGYEHVYQSDTSDPIPPKFFDVNLEKLCDVVEKLDPSSLDDMAKLEPLREFTLPSRDLRYNQVFDKYRTQFARQYEDDREEAVRKNVVMQSTRFSASGNRQGATSELGATILSDRLQVEVIRMTGGTGAAAALAKGSKRDSFPYSREEMRTQERKLPSEFDWRPRGAVSPVAFQTEKCSSCWAFAVAGAVEGALYRRTRRLVPLSYQCLVDCAHPFGGNGCSGTWPVHAYDYIQDRGLPALDEYPSYKAQVETCVEQRVPSQTRITGHVNVTTNSVPALKIAIKRHCPNVVIVDSLCKSFILHRKGVLYDDRCGKQLRQLNHAVLAVGWGERRGEPHFILKNSWSDKWGEKGYIRVHARSNTCGVLTMPTYPVLEEGDVRQPLRAGARPSRQGPAQRLPAPNANDAAQDLDY